MQDWNDGDEDAKERLLPFAYDELKPRVAVDCGCENCEKKRQKESEKFQPQPGAFTIVVLFLKLIIDFYALGINCPTLFKLKGS